VLFLDEFLAKAFAELAMAALKSLLGVSKTLPDTLNPNSCVTVADVDGETVGLLDRSQQRDLAGFLSSPDVQNLVQIYFLSKVAAESGTSAEILIADIPETFTVLARSWCADHEDRWDTLSGDIWREIDSYLSRSIPFPVYESLTNEERQDFKKQILSPSLLDKSKNPLPRFLRDALAIISSPERLERVNQSVSDIKSLIGQAYTEMPMQHSLEVDYRFALADLYVDRDLVAFSDTRKISSTGLLETSHRSRAIVTGDPGVGKSTFTTFAIKELSSASVREWVTPLIVQCREYAALGYPALTQAIREKLSKQLSLSIEHSELDDILTLGRAFIIVDGVDEILDLGRRRELVREVEAFGVRYPFCSILCTSRNIGYAQAQFSGREFERFELQPFTAKQRREYVLRWFGLVGKNESDANHFIEELGSVPDLRGNPLMLSLLCILYRARGYIPRNRRQVYAQCADLLFNRWDSSRRIEQPYDHEHYGEELMQEIARWFYTSQAAQAGVEGQQIEKVISSFFVDTAAVVHGEAARRAKDFLDFCAGRAWLLASTGTNERGQRIFVFTHRTFMEFFAAEAIVRNAESISLIVQEVEKTYSTDASSVLPDLIVQAAEVHRRHGARQIIEGLLGASNSGSKRGYTKYLPLCLRILNLSPIHARLRDEIIDHTFESWVSTTNSFASWVSLSGEDSAVRPDPPATDLATLKAVLELYRDPKARFVERLSSGLEDVAAASCVTAHEHPIFGFLINWSYAYLADEVSRYMPDWKPLVDDAIDKCGRHMFDIPSGGIIPHHMVDVGSAIFSNTEPHENLVLRLHGESVPGAVLRSFERVVFDKEPRPHDQRQLDLLAADLKSGKSIGHRQALALFEAVSIVARRNTTITCDTPVDSSVRAIALWISCVFLEGAGTIGPFDSVAEQILGFSPVSIYLTRNATVEESRGPVLLQSLWNSGEQFMDELDLNEEGVPKLSLSEVSKFISPRPRWLSSWMRGARAFVN
jgi:hypothetical protein